MSSPATVGTTAALVVNRNRNRFKLYLQNTGTTILYFKRQIRGSSDNTPSPTNYDFLINPVAAGAENEQVIYESIDALAVVSAAAGGLLAFYDTHFVNEGRFV